jgi:hypothetical protein
MDANPKFSAITTPGSDDPPSFYLMDLVADKTDLFQSSSPEDPTVISLPVLRCTSVSAVWLCGCFVGLW